MSEHRSTFIGGPMDGKELTEYRGPKTVRFFKPEDNEKIAIYHQTKAEATMSQPKVGRVTWVHEYRYEFQGWGQRLPGRVKELLQ